MTNWFSLALTFAAYTDTAVGLYLRCMMVGFVQYVDPELAVYVATEMHF